jgi:hypothetical protein
MVRKRNAKNKRWVSTGRTTREDVDLKLTRRGRIKECYLCKRDRRCYSLYLIDKSKNPVNVLEMDLNLLEVDLKNGSKFGFYLCDDCCLLLRLFSPISETRLVVHPERTY